MTAQVPAKALLPLVVPVSVPPPVGTTIGAPHVPPGSVVLVVLVVVVRTVELVVDDVDGLVVDDVELDVVLVLEDVEVVG